MKTRLFSFTLLIINIVYCFNLTIKNNKNRMAFGSPFYLKNKTDKILKIAVPTTFKKLKIIYNNSDNDTTSVRINAVPVYPISPASVAFLLI